ncbi:hypothetical protein [Providencia sp. 1709051003]|uniref:hypothetical protein n=1 Tax=Providencia sp. 1709051003 TaxID=2603246 RepID=UPI0034D39863
MNELKKCPLCDSKVKWCGENEPDPEDNHLCDHIECTNADCGADFSFTHNNDIYPDNSDDMTPEEKLKQLDERLDELHRVIDYLNESRRELINRHNLNKERL